ncbi:hypothetical protein [Sporolactobacillus laevolacticus]|uniref:hypothetical protein n=1 Tax=Sporolactobacillus laevolacticus TaxID=33018 RepID=UPI0025B5039F|nr:hypothetical protein [Sporolactobacillus laevolacticus]MDN3956019.1 hypothetical protein [Sporolactobacillus laevolacticus]
MKPLNEYLKRLEYLNRFSKEQKIWLSAMVTYMRTHCSDWEETTFSQMPTYFYNGKYIAFLAARDHFTFHTSDDEQIRVLKSKLPNAKYGKRCVRVPISDTSAISVLFEVCLGARGQANLSIIRERTKNILNNDSVAKKLLQ